MRDGKTEGMMERGNDGVRDEGRWEVERKGGIDGIREGGRGGTEGGIV